MLCKTSGFVGAADTQFAVAHQSRAGPRKLGRRVALRIDAGAAEQPVRLGERISDARNAERAIFEHLVHADFVVIRIDWVRNDADVEGIQLSQQFLRVQIDSECGERVKIAMGGKLPRRGKSRAVADDDGVQIAYPIILDEVY